MRQVKTRQGTHSLAEGLHVLAMKKVDTSLSDSASSFGQLQPRRYQKASKAIDERMSRSEDASGLHMTTGFDTRTYI